MRLWLDRRTFVELDEDGYCTEHPLEGAMGFVIKAIQPIAGDYRYIAWKLPRLLADTQRENTYIEQALAAECHYVENVKGLDGSKTLIEANLPNPFTDTIPGITSDSEDFPPDATYWLLVSFDKERPPRFCCIPVAVDGTGRYSVKDDEVKPPIDKGRPQSIKTCPLERRHGSTSPAPALVRTVVNGEPKPTPPLGSLAGTVRKPKKDPVWYLGVSSICYEWAHGTLQEAINREKRGDWSASQHLQLIERLLTGLDILHARKQIHGDLRPANIMYRRDPTDPGQYCLTDYGSFAQGPGAAIPDHGTDKSEGTQLEAISAVRVSPYYAPERASGREDENADAALLVSLPNALLVLVGWRSQFLQNEQAISEYVDSLTKSGGQLRVTREASQDVLQEGDRVRLRDFVFDIEQAGHFESFRVYLASKQVWMVVHERLLVPARLEDLHTFAAYEEPAKEDSKPVRPRVRMLGTKVPDEQANALASEASGSDAETNGRTTEPDSAALRDKLVSLSRVIELPQWTSASDIYAVGAIALRSCFPSQAEQRADGSAERTIEVERRFLELMSTVGDHLYASVIWEKLDYVCRQIERSAEEAQASGGSAAFLPKVRVPADELPFELKSRARSDVKLLDLADEVTMDLTSTIPEADRLLTMTFGCNSAVFLLFIHFCLSCLHRTSAFSFPVEGTRPFFSRDRRAHGHEATRRALRRVSELMRLCNDTNPVLKKMTCDPSRVQRYELRSSAELTLENRNLQHEVLTLGNQINDLQSRLAESSTELDRTRHELAQREGELFQSSGVFDARGKQLQHLSRLLGLHDDMDIASLEQGIWNASNLQAHYRDLEARYRDLRAEASTALECLRQANVMNRAGQVRKACEALDSALSIAKLNDKPTPGGGA